MSEITHSIRVTTFIITSRKVLCLVASPIIILKKIKNQIFTICVKVVDRGVHGSV